MPCMCGDSCCPSCGPAQGNSRCPVCRAWASEGGCEDPQRCQDELPNILKEEEEAISQLLMDEEEADRLIQNAKERGIKV